MRPELKTILSAAIIALGLVAAPVAAQEGLLHVKVYDHGNEMLHGVKAIGADGTQYDVKAFRAGEGDRHILRVKALIEGVEVPVKVVAREGDVYSVKAIEDDGTIVDVKAVAPDGRLLDVKAVQLDGHILSIKATGPDGSPMPVKAFTATGHTYDIKGVRLVDDGPSGNHGGTDYHAHVKAVLPAHGH